MKLKKYFIMIFSLIIILLFQGKYIIERSSKICMMQKSNARKSLKSNIVKDEEAVYYKNFSFYKIVEAVYSINKKVKLSKITKNSDDSFTLTINFNKKDTQVEQVVYKLKKIKYFYRIDKIVQDSSGNVGITFVFNNQHKIENTV